ncbi:MAG: thiamine-phosphate kinase [Caulobacteraceae bacterium]
MPAGPEAPPDAPVDEFDWIASLRPLAAHDPRALALMDDAAVIPARPGFDLVVSKDALVEGVHAPWGVDGGIFAKRLLRTSLSDLAAKAAEPFGWFLLAAFPAERGRSWRAAFAKGMAEDGERFNVALLGGDTVATTGPAVVSATVLGWVGEGRSVLRSGAREGDALVICGAIGDGLLGHRAVKGEIADPAGALAGRYLLPEPLLRLRSPLLAHARACADISDGLLADAGHIAEASGFALEIDLAAAPLSAEGAAWLEGEADRASALLELAAGGDDYALACAVDPADAQAFIEEVRALGLAASLIGRFEAGVGLKTWIGDLAVSPGRLGWRH